MKSINRNLLCLIRHAEIKYDINNPQLSEYGEHHICKVSEKLADYEWDIIVTSSYTRARQSAHILSKKLNVEVLEYKDLREREHGIINGLEKNTISEKINFLSDVPGRETIREFYKRINGIFKVIMSENINKNIIIVAHGGVLKILSGLILKYHVSHWRYAEARVFEWCNREWKLLDIQQ